MNFLSAFTNDLWAMEPTALERLLATLAEHGPSAISQRTVQAEPDDYGYQVSNGIAHIPVAGVLAKDVPWIYRALGISATGYSDIARAMDDAEADPQVDAIMLAIDSPGGAVDGIHALADRIHAATKPVMAHMDSLGASAAYWLASQADTVTAGRGAQVGSIGVYTAHVDVSRAAENAGVKVRVFASGSHKGAGHPGTALTAEQQAEIQGRIDARGSEFVADVARGRGVSSTHVQPAADGRVFSATDALQRGLIDRITSDPSKDYLMAKDAAAQSAYLKQTMALCAEHPTHAAAILASSEKDLAIEQIRADIAVANKSAQEAKAKADLETRIVALTAAIDAEKAAHEATKATMANVQRERDALAALQTGAAAGNGVKPEPVPKSIKKMPQAEYDKLDLEAKVLAGRLMASGELIVEG